ncbi:MAG: DUF5011 domain-containing protein [Bacteroidetes bacterium]|nr:DUF5011 domain-containing protein [Bacteroidota bacterium]
MKKKFTQKSIYIAFLLLFIVFGNFKSNAQSYCTPYSYYGCSYNTVRYWAIERVQIKDISSNTIFDKPADGCNEANHSTVNVSPNGYSHVSIKSAFTLSSGSKYTIGLSTSYQSGTTYYNTYSVMFFMWIDLNRDGTFSSSEYMSTGWTNATTGNASGVGGNLAYNTFTVPCGISTGTSRMRIISSYSYVLNSSSSCPTGTSGSPTYYYGEIEDHTITLANPTSLSAGFYMPNSTFVGTPVKMTNANQTGYISHDWDINDDGSIEYKTTNAVHIFNTVGTQCVRLKSTNCLGKDSVLKCINVVNPTSKPIVDFAVKENEIERYGTANFIDLSTNGPTYWSWFMYDPNDSAATRMDVETFNSNLVGNDPFTNANPSVFFNTTGNYTVCLQNSNSLGPSNILCKPNYLRVTPPKDNNLGAGTVQPIYEQTGNIIDDGGRTGNYSNNRVDYATIIPCGAKTITLTFSQFKVANGDYLKIYDGVNTLGKPLHPGSGFSNTVVPTAPLIATSGAMYLYFSSNSSGTDSGFIAKWTTDRGPTVAPVADFVIPDTLYNPVSYTFQNTSLNTLGNTSWVWSIEPGFGEVSYDKDMVYSILTDNNYDVTLEATTCMGYSSYTKKIVVVTPHTKAELDFDADNRRPSTGEIVTLNAKSAINGKAIKADKFKWSFFPSTVSFVNGTTENDPIVQVTFNAKGKYTVSMKGWNTLDSSSTSNTVIKSDYVIVVEHCTPLLGISSSTDIAINNVTIEDYNAIILLNNSSFNNQQGYDDYTKLVPEATLTFGATYKFSTTRSTNINPMSRKVWIDWNIDGDFDDAGELIAYEATAYTIYYSTTFKVPSIKNAFEGRTRMRIGTSYSTDPNLPCGASSGVNNANRLGEFEDYSLLLVNDKKPPILTLNNEDTLFLEVGTTYNEYGAKAIDDTEGDISSNIQITSDLDMAFTGIYYVTYNVEDAGGNDALPVTRVVYVVKDKLPPTLSLNGSDTVKIEVFGNYVEDGATAFDNKDGNLTNSIVIYGSVNTNVIGTYILTYLVRDESGNQTTKNRVIIVKDSEKPFILNTDADVNNEIKVQIMSFFIDRTKVTDNYDNPNLIVTSGELGYVDTRFKGVYTITYNATDGSGNKADPKTYHYNVEDYIKPTIVLNTLDTVIHPVNKIYTPVQASVFDNFYDVTQVSITMTSNVIFYKLGLYYDEFTATDGSGNITVRKRFIRVVDNEAPVLNGYPINVGLWSKFDPTEGITITDNYYSPNELRPKLKLLYTNLNTFVEGLYVATYNVTDPSGNVSLPFNRIINVNRNYPTITSGISEINKNISLNIYPNPSHGILNIDFSFSTPENISIEIYNSSGALVYNESNIIAQNGTKSIDLSNFSNGLYNVRTIVSGKQVNRQILLNK